MQFRHRRCWRGVEPRFFARHLARNLLPAPSCPAPRAAAESPALIVLPGSAVHPDDAATDRATHTAAACGSPAPWPTPGDCSSSSAPPLAASVPNSNVDISSHSPFHAPWGVFFLSHFRGSLHSCTHCRDLSTRTQSPAPRAPLWSAEMTEIGNAQQSLSRRYWRPILSLLRD